MLLNQVGNKSTSFKSPGQIFKLKKPFQIGANDYSALKCYLWPFFSVHLLKMNQKSSTLEFVFSTIIHKDSELLATSTKNDML